MIPCPTCADSTVTAFCRECGKGICDNCAEPREGVPYCRDCAPALIEGDRPQQEYTPPSPPPPRRPPTPPAAALPPGANGSDGPHPFLAGLLGFVPGLGAVYNGQYVKGIVHAAIFGMLIAISTTADHDAIPALMVPMVVFFVLYMPIEAVRTAQAIRRGEEVQEMSGIVGALFDASNDSPVPGILFIVLGVFFLLFTLGVVSVEVVLRAWPLIIVALGVWRLYASVRKRDESTQPAPRATTYDLPE